MFVTQENTVLKVYWSTLAAFWFYTLLWYYAQKWTIVRQPLRAGTLQTV